jgi:hypothetical protein
MADQTGSQPSDNVQLVFGAMLGVSRLGLGSDNSEEKAESEPVHGELR